MCASSTCKKPGILGWTCCRLKERIEEKRESQPPIHGFMRCHKEKVRFMERISIHMTVFSGKWRGIRQGRRCGGSCVCLDDWDRLSLLWSWESKSLKPMLSLPASHNNEHECKIVTRIFWHMAVWDCLPFKSHADVLYTFCLCQDGGAPSRKAAHWDSSQMLIRLQTQLKGHERMNNINTIASGAGQKWQRKTSGVFSRVGNITRCAFVQQAPHHARCRLPWALHCTKRPQPGMLKVSEEIEDIQQCKMMYWYKERNVRSAGFAWHCTCSVCSLQALEPEDYETKSDRDIDAEAFLFQLPDLACANTKVRFQTTESWENVECCRNVMDMTLS